MTLERESRNGPFVVSCNRCSETEELEGEAFHEALEDARERGFRPVAVGGGWNHFCRDCK